MTPPDGGLYTGTAKWTEEWKAYDVLIVAVAEKHIEFGNALGPEPHYACPAVKNQGYLTSAEFDTGGITTISGEESA